MATQDDNSFRSQQFANDVGQRQDRMAETRIGLNMQAGQLTAQAMEQWRAQGRYQAEMAGAAHSLAKDEMELQQAREEMAWTKELVGNKMVLNALERDKAQTALAKAQAEEAQSKLTGFDPRLATDPISMAGAQAAGINMEWDPDLGRMVKSKRPLSLEQRQMAYQRWESATQARYGSRSQPRQSSLLDEAKKAADAGDYEAADTIMDEWRKTRGMAPKSKGDGGSKVPEAKTEATAASIPGLGVSNSERAISYFKAPERIASLRDAFMRNVPEDRKKAGYHLSDDDVVERAVGILRNPEDPRYKAVVQKLVNDGAIDPEEMKKAQGNQADMNKFLSPWSTGADGRPNWTSIPGIKQ